MKRFFAIILAAVLVAAVLCACGDDAIKTTVESKYDDGFAKDYASNVSTDSNGNTVYEFTDEKYEEFTTDYKNSLNTDIESDIAAGHEAAYGQFAYINEADHAVVVGLNDGEYDEATAQAEADKAAEYGFKYFQNLREPVDTLTVKFVFANDQSVVFGSFEYTAE